MIATEVGLVGINEHDVAKDPGASREIFLKDIDRQTGEVRVTSPTLRLDDYLAITPEDDKSRLLKLADSLKGRRISFINATAEGGGVAIMRTSQIFLLRELGVDAHWFVTNPSEEPFRVTKSRLHNVFQGVANEWLTDQDAAVYHQWSGDNAQRLEKSLADSDVVVIDDPQPAGLIPYIRGIEGKRKIIFRSHIHSLGDLMSREGTPQHRSWEFLWQSGVSEADLYIYHPVEDFIPGNVPPEKTVLMPPSADPLDGLNRSLTEAEIVEGLAFFNQQLKLNENQNPLDPSRPYIIQIARFDPSKGIPDVLEAYNQFYQWMIGNGFAKETIPQLVITGNGSVDDPDGVPVLADTMYRRLHLYGNIAEDIKVARMSHFDQGLNTLLRRCLFALQMSRAEGFEYKIQEAQMKRRPVIVSNVGGMPLQVAHGKSGFLVEPGNTRQATEYMFILATQPETYARLSAGALRRAYGENYEFTTVPNVINWLWLIGQLLENPNFKGNRQNVRKLVSSSI